MCSPLPSKAHEASPNLARAAERTMGGRGTSMLTSGEVPAQLIFGFGAAPFAARPDHLHSSRPALRRPQTACGRAIFDPHREPSRSPVSLPELIRRVPTDSHAPSRPQQPESAVHPYYPRTSLPLPDTPSPHPPSSLLDIVAVANVAARRPPNFVLTFPSIDSTLATIMNSFYYDSVLDAFKKPDVTIPPIPPHLEHPIVSTQWGHTYLWAVFFIMAGFSVLFFISSQRASYRYRLMHTTTFFITAIAALSYFAMATGVGKTLTTIGEHRHGAPREFFYARYLDWALTTPLLLFDLTLLAGLPVAEIIVLVLADEVMIVTGVIAGVHPTKTGKWGFFTFSCVAFAWVLLQLVTSGRSTAFLRSPKVGGLYNQISLALVVVWTLYPVAFALCEGTGKLSPDKEILFFAILDVIAKPLWGAWLLIATPDEGHVLVPESLCAPAGSPASGGYGAISQEPRAEDA